MAQENTALEAAQDEVIRGFTANGINRSQQWLYRTPLCLASLWHNQVSTRLVTQ